MAVIATVKKTPINEEIREKEVRVIDSNGDQLGLMSSREALSKAEEKELDLVMISPNAKPPVCKIMDHGKYVYEQTKKTKEAKKKQKVTTIKEVRMSATIEENDINIKANKARKFLQSGDKVKVSVRFRGREMSNTKVGHVILDNFHKKVEDVCMLEKPSKMEGRNMIMVLAPKKD